MPAPLNAPDYLGVFALDATSKGKGSVENKVGGILPMRHRAVETLGHPMFKWKPNNVKTQGIRV